MRRSDGVTLIELMIAISIMAILMAIATPSFLQMRQNAVFRQATADIGSMLREARTRTATANLEHRVEFTATQYRLVQGDRSSGSTAWATVIQNWTPVNPPQGVTLVVDAGCNVGPSNIDFNTNGTAGVPGIGAPPLCTVSVQNAAGVNQYLITVTPNTGRIRITKA